MFVWTDPLRKSPEEEAKKDQAQARGLVSARWLALDSILRSLIHNPEGPELRAMMRRDVRTMKVAGKVHPGAASHPDAYQEAAGVMVTWKKSMS